MIINLELDAAAQAAPAAVKAIWQQAATIIGSMFTDNITINLSVDYSGTGGGADAGPASGQSESYSSVYSLLKNSASPGDSSFTGLPLPSSANAPTSIVVWDAQLKAMGLLTANGAGIDGDVHFDTDISQNLLLGVALHEFTHAMGRVPDGTPDIMELDRFSSVGNRVYDGGVPAAEASYFSLNGGATKWADYGVHSDPSDTMNNYVFEGAYYLHQPKLQPFAKFETQRFVAAVNGTKDINRYGFGANYYIRGQNLKWTIQYLRALPQNGSTIRPSNEFTMQLQVFYF